MIKGFYEFCSLLRRKKIFGWQYVYKACKLFLNLFYPISQRYKRSMGINKENEVIVSMASFPKRIGKVWITVASVMNQTIKPRKIILWLAEDLFPNKEADLPGSLLKMRKRGLEIRFCEDLWPHKKYFFSMKEFPDDIIVTVDDDVLYPENVLEQLIIVHRKFPNAVCCQRGHVLSYTEKGEIDKYGKWDSEVKGLMEPTMQLFPIGCGGVLYPPHLLNKQLFDKDEIKRLCLANDDIWLKTMEVLNRVPAVRGIPDTLIYFDIIGTRRSALLLENANECRNDKIMADVCADYPMLTQVLYNDWLRREKENAGK